MFISDILIGLIESSKEGRNVDKFLKTEGVFFEKLINVPGYHFKPYF
jgi:hypothetical protein